MFVHNFKYSFKTLFRNRALLFWTFCFPLILGTFFNMAFSNITESEKMSSIDIAIVDDENFKNDLVFSKAFENLDDSNEDGIFAIKYVDEAEAKKLLEKDEISAYLKIEDGTPKIIANTSGIDQTVLKQVTEEISNMSSIVESIVTQKIADEVQIRNREIDYEKIYTEAVASLEVSTSLRDTSKDKLDYVMIEFYTLIAMTCLYGGILGLTSINQSLANMSNKGKRVSISPSKKLTIISSSLLASYIAQLIGLFLLFVYTIFVLKIDYGNDIGLVILLSLIGSLAGLSLGIYIGSVLKTNENAKTGILIASTMFGCFLSGMFGISMKNIVDQNLPFINKINPVAMITDGLYSLYYYDTQTRFWTAIISLSIFTIVMILISSTSLRRQRYDSI